MVLQWIVLGAFDSAGFLLGRFRFYFGFVLFVELGVILYCLSLWVVCL